MNQIEEKVKKIIREKTWMSIEDVHNDSSLINDLGADSLDFIEILIDIEKEFSISIPDEDAESNKLSTVQKIIDYVTERKNTIFS